MSKNKRLLMEGVEAGKFLADMMTSPVLFSLEETEGGRHKARGVFALADTPTSNRRIYPRKIWEREIGKLSKAIEDRKLFGTLDHPEDGRTKLSEVSHIITKLVVDGKQVIGECEILDTIPGQNLKAIIKGGGKVGVSSRGVGSTQQVDEGELVGDDYNLNTFDFVANPAEISAYPKMVVEEKLNQQGDTPMQLTEEMKKAITEETEKVRAEMQADFDKKSDTLLTENQSLAGKLTEAKTVLKRVGFDMFLSNYLTEQDKKEAIMELLGDIMLFENVDVLKEKVDAIRKNVGLNEGKKEQAYVRSGGIACPFCASYNIEGGDRETDDGVHTQQVQCLDCKKTWTDVFKLVDVKLDEAKVFQPVNGNLNQKALTEDLKEIRTKIQSLVEDRQVQTKQLTEQAQTIKTLESDKKKLQEEFNTAVALAENLGLRAYMEQKLQGNPNAVKVRRMFEQQSPDTKEKVDSLIESCKTPSEEFKRIGAGLKRGLRPASDNNALEESENGKSQVSDGTEALNEELKNIGVDVNEVLALSNGKK